MRDGGDGMPLGPAPAGGRSREITVSKRLIVRGWLIIYICAALGPGVAPCVASVDATGSRTDTGTPAGAEVPRTRLRDLGIVIGRMAPGPNNAITDVQGARVGQVTLNRGKGKLVPGQGPVRTGVTAILPHGGGLWRDKGPAATWGLDGAGGVAGGSWVDTQGALEARVVLGRPM